MNRTYPEIRWYTQSLPLKKGFYFQIVFIRIHHAFDIIPRIPCGFFMHRNFYSPMSDLRLTAPEISSRLDRILPLVEKPGRYTGGELNQVVKNWDEVSVRVALVFPDIYDLGMSNLGLAILYDLLNKRQDVLAERAFSPWTDMEDAMRLLELPLFSLESKHPIADFDILGISLPYETLYTNTLNILDLSGIPLFSEDRGKDHPLVVAGGHGTARCLCHGGKRQKK